MYKTVEVRWFQNGRLPSDINTWFARCPGEADGWESRVDSYLNLDKEDIGIKLREGRLEIKHRSDKIGYLQFNHRMAGLVERWWKTGADLTHFQVSEDLLLDTQVRWKPVSKERNLRLYRSKDFGFDSTSGSLKDGELTGNSELELGCTLEIATIQLMGQNWWSLAFEAFGEPGQAYRFLLKVINQLSEIQKPPELRTSESYSYPRWLSILGSA